MNVFIESRILTGRGLCILFVIVYLAILFFLGFIGSGHPFPISMVFSLPGMIFSWALASWAMANRIKVSDPIYGVVYVSTNIIFYGVSGYIIGIIIEKSKKKKGSLKNNDQ